MPNKTYLDSAGLSTFLTNLKAAYAGNNTEAFSTFTVAKAGRADQLTTARTISFATGDVTGSFSFDGSANVSDVALSVADVVASTGGAGGSHGLMTAAQAEKLAGVATGAQANVIETVKVNGTALTPDANKAVDITIPAAAVTDVQTKTSAEGSYTSVLSGTVAQIDLSGYALKSDITSVLNFKGTKADQASLPASENKTGDVWAVSADNSEYVWTGSAWEKLGPTIDLGGYVEKTQKVNNKALSGDITLDGSDIALSTNYAVASTAAAPSAGDTIDAAVGKLQAEIGTKADASSLGTIASHAEGDYVGIALAPAEAGAQVNDIEIVKFKGNGDASASALSIDSSDKSVTIDVSGYALTSSLGTAAAANTTDFVSSSLTPAEAGAQKNVIETIKVNGSALTPDANKAVDITVPAATVTDVQVKGNGDNAYATVMDGTVAKIDVSGYALSSDIPTKASAIADNDNGYATGDQVYDYIETLPISNATINGLFGIS